MIMTKFSRAAGRIANTLLAPLGVRLRPRRPGRPRVGTVANELLAPVGVRLERVRVEYEDLGLYPEQQRPETPRYLNIGAGAFYHPYWHNLDHPSDWYAGWQRIHISHDLMSQKPFPIGSETLKVVYTSHVVEHIRDDDVQYMFEEVYRCLQPGGFFRITCPDIDLEYDAYWRGDLAFWWWTSPYGAVSIEQRFLEHFAAALTLNHPDKHCKKYTDEEIRKVFAELPQEEALDFFTKQIPPEVQRARPGDHMNWFNISKLTTMLQKAGHKDIWESRFGQSKCALLRNTRLFDCNHPGDSLHIECQK